MAHGRYPVFACHLVRNQPTICSIDALNAPTRRCLAPTIGTYASRPHLRCTVAASEIPIAPADRGAHSPAVSFPGGFPTPARPPCCVWTAHVMGPASETRHRSGHRTLAARALGEHAIKSTGADVKGNYFARFQTTSAVPAPVSAGLVNLSSSPMIDTMRF